MEKHNFKIDADQKSVSITASTAVFPVQITLHAAYHFIENGKMVVDGDEKTITVTLIPEKNNSEAELEELAYEFNLQLVASFVENTEADRYSKLREGMMKAALSPPPRPFSSPPESGDKK